ncbi:T9SS type A sorting domain-containing protein [bacterium]|nr:T9SS type A sorting domain-containing protein [bacterium]
MKKLFLLLSVVALVLFAGMSWATTYTTPIIDGIITISPDWDADEQFVTQSFDNADYTLWITWDEATGLYVGIDRNEDPDNKFLGDGGDDISLFVAIDTDQIPGSGAPYDVYSTVSFGGSHLPEYIYSFAGGGGWYEWAWWDQLNGVFDYRGWRDDGTYYGWPGDVYLDDEVTILWSDIGHPTGIGVIVWITYEAADPWPPAVVAAWPEENPVGVGPHLIWAYEFYPGHYYTATGVSFDPQPAIDIIPNITEHSVPVALSSFTATGRGGAIEVSWTSQTEVNALAYHLLRGDQADGQFTEIAHLDAAGNSETPRDYRFVDSDIIDGRTYYYKLADEDYEGNMTYHGPVFASAGICVPGAYSLLPNYPNPFNPSTAISYEMPVAGHLTLTIYNVLGQELRTLVDAYQEAGTYTVMWDSKDNAGHYLNSGVYFYTMKSSDFTQTRKMVLMR